MIAIRRLVLLTIWSLVYLSAHADFTGKCVAVTDGDTIQVMHDGKAEKIRMDGIDAPESSQAFGSRAKIVLSSMVFGKEVIVHDRERDKYGRTLATIEVPDFEPNVNAWMIRNGMAWHYKQYNSDPVLAKSEAFARDIRIGLWSDPKPIAPWDYRHGTGDAVIVPEPGASTNSGAPAMLPEEKLLLMLEPREKSPEHAVKTNVDGSTQTVYTTNSGKKFHRQGCRYLRSSQNQTTVGVAMAAGYSPCSACNQGLIGAAAFKAPEASAGESDNQTGEVYGTRTGNKYHSAGCQFLRKSRIPMSLKDARSRGLSPCSKCNPR